MMPPQMPSRATSSPPKIPWVRRIRMYPTTAITSLSGQPRQSPCPRLMVTPTRQGRSIPLSAKQLSPSGRAAGSGVLLRRDVVADLVHVKVADGLDELLERRGGQGAGLGEHQHAIPERHQRGDRRNLRGGRETLLVLGVDLSEGDVLVLLARGLENRREHSARSAPRRPPVDQGCPLAGDGLLEVLLGQCDGAHYAPKSVVLPCAITAKTDTSAFPCRAGGRARRRATKPGRPRSRWPRRRSNSWPARSWQAPPRRPARRSPRAA